RVRRRLLCSATALVVTFAREYTRLNLVVWRTRRRAFDLFTDLLAPPASFTDKFALIKGLKLPAEQQRPPANPHVTDPMAAAGVNQLRHRVVLLLCLELTPFNGSN